MSDLRVIVVGTGGMAGQHGAAYAAMDGVEIVGAVDTRPENLAAFMAEFGDMRGFASVEEALDWGQFDAASNVTPDTAHHPTTLPLLAAGKHVLCEKPLAPAHRLAEEMAQAARDAGVVNMVNLSYREVPALIEAARIVAAGEIGEVRHFEASYLQSWLTQPKWGDWRTEDTWLWRLSKAHGSLGVLGDVGVHILDFATHCAGSDAASVSCRLTTFDKAPGGRIGDYLLDANDSFAMTVALEDGATGVIHASRFASGHLDDLRLRIFGTTGGIEVKYELGPSGKRESGLRTCLGSDAMIEGRWTEIEPPGVATNYVRFIEAVRAGRQVQPDFGRGAALQAVLDRAAQSDADGSRNLAV